MGIHRYSVLTSASPERAFDLWTDLERMKEWVGGVSKVTDLRGPIDRAGTTYTVWFGRMQSRTEVLEADRPRRFRTRFGNLVLKGENLATFEPDGDGTRVQVELRTRGLVSAIFARIFASGSYQGSFQGELNEFARLAAQSSGSSRS